MKRIAVIGGDGTGPEVVAEALKCLRAVADKVGFDYETKSFDWGGDRYLKDRRSAAVRCGGDAQNIRYNSFGRNRPSRCQAGDS